MMVTSRNLPDFVHGDRMGGSGPQVQLQEVLVPPATLTMPERRGKPKPAETMVQWRIYNACLGPCNYNVIRFFSLLLGGMGLFCAFGWIPSANPNILKWWAAGKSPNLMEVSSSENQCNYFQATFDYLRVLWQPNVSSKPVHCWWGFSSQSELGLYLKIQPGIRDSRVLVGREHWWPCTGKSRFVKMWSVQEPHRKNLP